MNNDIETTIYVPKKAAEAAIALLEAELTRLIAENERLRELIRRADPSRDDFEWETWLFDARNALAEEVTPIQTDP